MSIARFHSRFLEQPAVEIAAAEPVIAGLAPAVLLGDDLHAEPDQRADVGGDEAVAADDVDHAPAAASATLTWATRGSRARAAASIRWHKRDLVGERDEAQRIVGAVHRLVGARRRRRRRALRRIEQLERRGGALDRGLADLVGVGESGGLAGHAAQAEARGGVIIGGLQPAVVEAERLARAILKIELAVVVARQRCRAASRFAPSGSRLR